MFWVVKTIGSEIHFQKKIRRAIYSKMKLFMNGKLAIDGENYS